MRPVGPSGHGLCSKKRHMYAEREVGGKGAGEGAVCEIGGGSRLFQRFTVQKALGGGGAGPVWLAQDDRLGQLVVLKLVPEILRFDADAFQDLKKATRKSVFLMHPNIVRVFDFIEDESCAAIVSEFIDGPTLLGLRSHKRAQCFAVGEIAPWVSSLCDALAYAHDSMGLVHGGLKPADLMVNERMKLKVTDFGTADRAEISDEARVYLSPQRRLGAAPTPSDDIYAVGATLHELLSSKPPFSGEDDATQIRESTPPWVSERRKQLGIAGEAVPKHWEETIAACLAKDPADRPQSAVEIARLLRLGGTIRLAVEEQESKTRYLAQSLTQARVVGAAAGLAALIAAAILAIRATHPTLSSVKETVGAVVPDGYALELFRPDATPKVTLAPDPIATPFAESIPDAPEASKAPKNGSLQLTTAPAGARFAIYPGVVAGNIVPATSPLHAGTAPESIDDLAPGHYTLFFHNEGWPEESTEVSLEAGESLPVAYIFPHGSANLTSTPDGAEIFLGARSLGYAPLTVDLPLGKQQLAARLPGYPERTQSVTIQDETPAAIAFQMRASSADKKRKAKRPESALDKLGQSLKNVFSRKPAPAKKKS